MTERVLSQIRGARMGFLQTVRSVKLKLKTTCAAVKFVKP